MKRAILVALFLLAMNFAVFGQQPRPSAGVSDKNWDELLVAVSDENWNEAVTLSSKLLKELKEDDERLPRLRYIYLYAAAGKVSEGNMTFEDLEKSVKPFVGKDVVLPYREITLDCVGALNFICPSKESKDKLVIPATNNTGTTILAFEYVQLKEPFDFSRLEGEDASIAGIIEAIEPNPNKSRAIVMRIYISKASVKLKEKPKKEA